MLKIQIDKTDCTDPVKEVNVSLKEEYGAVHLMVNGYYVVSVIPAEHEDEDCEEVILDLAAAVCTKSTRMLTNEAEEPLVRDSEGLILND